MDAVLKSCPFCGGEAKVNIRETAFERKNAAEISVVCTKCGVSTSGEYAFIDNSILNAIPSQIKKWNTRTGEQDYIEPKERVIYE